MNKRTIKEGLFGASIVVITLLTSCRNDSDVVSSNLSTAADNFEIERRVVFYNGITGEYILQIEGRYALGNSDTNKRMSVTCKVGEKEYKKHFLGLSDNVTFFAEQMEPTPASEYRYRVTFKPSIIVPDIQLR